MLRDNPKLQNLNIQRITFNEITKNAVKESLKEPRKINDNLVNAYLARRALDFLVGFNLSPVLWRKLPGSKSAGTSTISCFTYNYRKRVRRLKNFNHKNIGH